MLRKPDLHIPKASLGGKMSRGGDDIENSAVELEGHVQVQVQMQVQESARQRLRRHWNEVGGQVLIPEKWGKEDLLKEWIEYPSFDALLAPSGIGLAREALVAEGRRAGGGGRSQRMRIETRC